MKTTIFLATLATALASGSLAAQAGCADPRTHTSGSALPVAIAPSFAGGNQSDSKRGGGIVGTWLVTYTAGGSPSGQAFIQWHSDGTEWENINFPISGGNICLGSWQKMNSKTVSRNHWGWLYTDGELSGSFNETETDTVAQNGTYTGTNDTKIYDLNGNLLTEFPGTSSAVLISP